MEGRRELGGIGRRAPDLPAAAGHLLQRHASSVCTSTTSAAMFGPSCAAVVAEEAGGTACRHAAGE